MPQLVVRRKKHAMRYQLVLQFQGDSLADFDQMVALEDALIETLAVAAKVSGHDIGSGETNIFIRTSDPKGTFERARLLLESRGHLEELTAAYRPAGGEHYTVIWPEGSDRRFKVT